MSGNRLHDLTNKVFGQWTVLERAVCPQAHARWKCQCSCGKIKVIYGFTLYRGVSTSCGHIDLVGQKFAHLLVLEPAGKNKQGFNMWKCVCDCGTETRVATGMLRSGGTKQCKQCGYVVTHQGNITHGMTDTKEYQRLTSVKRREKEASLDCVWTLDMELMLQELQPVCVLCGGSHKLATDHVYPLGKGYGLVPGNAIRLCKYCNSSKAMLFPEDMPADKRDAIMKAAAQFKEAWEKSLS